MSTDLTTGIVRILTPNGTTAGTGFVVADEGLIAICAHVVAYAGAGPGGTVRVVFHATGEIREAKVEPDWWRDPDAEDVAILRLDEPLPEGVTPLLLGSSGGTSGHPFKTFGFPAVEGVEGMWGYGNLGDPTTEVGQRVLQLTGTTEVTLGFSGAPVLNIVTRRVVGMVTSITIPDQYRRLTETAFITPTETRGGAYSTVGAARRGNADPRGIPGGGTSGGCYQPVGRGHLQRAERGGAAAGTAGFHPAIAL